MIEAIDIYNTVNRLLKKDDQSGYFSFDDFNEWCPLVESSLMNTYCKIHEQTSEVMDSLHPFLMEVPLTLINGLTDKPSDYRKWTDVGYNYTLNGTKCGSNPTVTEVDVDYCHSDEWKTMLTSAIRKPDVSKGRVRFRFVNSKIECSEKNAIINFGYIRNPVYASIGYTVNVANDELIYNSGTTKNFEWLEKDFQNIVDLFIANAGFSLREAAFESAKIR